MRITRGKWGVALSAALLLSCGIPTDICGCPPARSHAVLYGVVQDASGGAVADASVQATIFRTVCGEGIAQPAPSEGPVRTTSAGAYRLHLYSWNAYDFACVRVEAGSPGGGARGAAAVALRLRSDREQPDSVRVDLTVR